MKSSIKEKAIAAAGRPDTTTIQQERIWLSAPHMGEQEHWNLIDAYRSNWIAPLGPFVDGFEQDLQTYLGREVAAVALSSGTASLHLALVLAGVQAGDYVICQSMTFSASANPIRYQGATPVFVDSEAGTWNMCPDHLLEAIEWCQRQGKLPKAIIPVHLYGMPAQMDRIMEIAMRYNIAIIEDAAEALGSSFHGIRCGTIGDYGILSFNGNKIITTSGGGALLCHSAALAEKARYLATQARDPAPHYEHSTIGFNYRLSNICAAIGRGQMQVLNLRVSQRRANFYRYVEALQHYPFVSFQEEPSGCSSNRWLTAIVLDETKIEKGTAYRLIRFLAERNIEARPLWKPMHLQPVFESCPYFGSGVSEQLFAQGLCLPSGSSMTARQFDFVISLLYDFFDAI